MPRVSYGDRSIEYATLIKDGLKSHYISVKKGEGVVLRGCALPEEEADKLVLKKARWILDKLELVKSIEDDDIVTGSRVMYLGRRYYVEVLVDQSAEGPTSLKLRSGDPSTPRLRRVYIEFTESRFRVMVPTGYCQEDIAEAFEVFFRKKAKEKIGPRVYRWAETMGLEFGELKFMKLEKRWGSCTAGNNILINIDAVKLPWSLIDYLIVHELVHTKVKNHSKEFWAEVSRYLRDWKERDEKMGVMGL